MKTKTTIVGQRFGRLTVLSELGNDGHNAMLRCKCDCGVIKDFKKNALTRKKDMTRSCGCLKRSLLQGKTIICKRCGKELPISAFYIKDGVKTRHNSCKNCMKPIFCKARKERNIRDKKNAIEHYGGVPPKCACCGERHVEFLTIDHIHGGGTKHRRQLVHGSGATYRWLRDQNWPSGFRVLCINCNYSRGLFGYCPHEKEKKGDQDVPRIRHRKVH